MNVDKEAKKVLWSLQNDKRSAKERVNFQATGRKPKKNGVKYVLAVLLGIFALSYVMVQFQKTVAYVCFTNDFCIDSKNDVALYIFYVFITNVILVFAIYLAYKIGKKVSELLLA